MSRLAEHQNVIRPVFQTADCHGSEMPGWVIEQLMYAQSDGASATSSCSLAVEWLPTTLRSRITQLEEQTGLPLDDESVVGFALDAAAGCWHLFNHGAMHLELTCDTVRWAPAEGEDASSCHRGRSVLSRLRSCAALSDEEVARGHFLGSQPGDPAVGGASALAAGVGPTRK